MALFPFFLWVLPNSISHSITFLTIGVLFVFSKYIRELIFLNDTLEIVFLFLLFRSLINQLGLGNYFPLDIVICIFSLYLFLFYIKKTSASDLNLKIGIIQKNILISFLFAVISIAALSVWFISNGSNPYAKNIPEAPTVLLILMGVGFAAINAVYEEGIFRSILFSYFSKKVGFISALVLQSLWFSFIHYQTGFPSGSTGILMTFIFGIMMGYLVYKTRGIMIPIVVHFVADMSIFLLVLSRVKGLV